MANRKHVPHPYDLLPLKDALAVTPDWPEWRKRPILPSINDPDGIADKDRLAAHMDTLIAAIMRLPRVSLTAYQTIQAALQDLDGILAQEEIDRQGARKALSSLGVAAFILAEHARECEEHIARMAPYVPEGSQKLRERSNAGFARAKAIQENKTVPLQQEALELHKAHPSWSKNCIIDRIVERHTDPATKKAARGYSKSTVKRAVASLGL